MKNHKLRKIIALVLIVVIPVVSVYFADNSRYLQENGKQEEAAVRDIEFEKATFVTKTGEISALCVGMINNISKNIETFDEKNELLSQVEELKNCVNEEKESLCSEIEKNKAVFSNNDLKLAIERQNAYFRIQSENFSVFETKLEKFENAIVNGDVDDNKLKQEWTQLAEFYQPEIETQATGDLLSTKSVDVDTVDAKVDGDVIPAYETNSSEVAEEDLVVDEEEGVIESVENNTDELKTPIEIYEYVKNKIDFEPYYGVRKGVKGTVYEKAGNDMDQSALLVSLLRNAGYPARYVTGTIKVDIEDLMSWTGTSSKNAAVEAFASLGIPTTVIKSGGTICGAQVEHTWVEVYMSYEYYRGTEKCQGKKNWIPLDPSYKQYEVIKVNNFEEMTGIDVSEIEEVLGNKVERTADKYACTYVDNADALSLLDNAESNIEKYINENDLQDADIVDIIGGKKIIEEKLELLPNVLPYEVVCVNEENSELREDLSEKIQFSIGGSQVSSLNFGNKKDFSVSYNAQDLYGSSIYLKYEAATPEDQEIIDYYGSIEKTPSYLIMLVPTLYVDNQKVAEGKAVQAGYRQKFSITMHHSGMEKEVIDNPVTVGGFYSVGLDFGTISVDELNEQKANLSELANNVTEANMYDSEVMGSVLDNVIKTYFGQLDGYNSIIEKAADVQSVRLISEAMAGYTPSVQYTFNVPTEFKGSSFYIDVDHNVFGVTSNEGNKENEIAYMFHSGTLSSAMEHVIFEQITGTPSVSTIRVLEEANKRGIQIYSIGKSNVDYVDDFDISTSVKKDVKNAVADGKIVIIPEKEIQFGEWNGSGYIVYDAATGAAGYLISGGISGGSTAVDVIVGLVAIIDVIWAVVDIITIAGAVIAATNPIACALYFALYVVSIYTLIDTMMNIYDYYYSGNYYAALSLGIDLALNLVTFGLFKILQKISPAIETLWKKIASKLDGLKKYADDLGETITNAIVRHNGDTVLKEADDVVKSLRGSGVADDLIEKAAEKSGIEGITKLDDLVKKGVDAKTVEDLVDKGFDLNVVDDLVENGIHPKDYPSLGITSSTEAKAVDDLIKKGFDAADIKKLADYGIEPSGYRAVGVNTAEDASKLASDVEKLKNAGMSDNAIEEILRKKGKDGIDKAADMLDQGKNANDIEKQMGGGSNNRVFREATEHDADLIKDIKSKYNAGKSRNAASAKGKINGDVIDLECISGKFSHENYFNKGNFEPPLPQDYHYNGPIPEFTNHTEQKIVEYLRTIYKNNPNVSGEIEIISEREFCDNCRVLVDMFEEEFPNIKVIRVEVIK